MACTIIAEDGKKYTEEEFKAHLLSGAFDTYVKDKILDNFLLSIRREKFNKHIDENSQDKEQSKYIEDLFDGNKSTVEIVEAISSLVKDNFLNSEIEKLLPFLRKNPEIKFVKTYSVGMGESYLTGEWTVRLAGIKDDKTLLRVLVHELYHAISVNQLLNDTHFEKKVDDLRNEAIDSLNLREYLNGAVNTDFGINKNKDYYGLLDAKEFIAELFSNRQFNELLNSTQLSGNKTILDKFLDLLKGVLGITSPSYSDKIKKSILAGIDAKIDFVNDPTVSEVMNNLKNAHSESDFKYSPQQKFSLNSQKDSTVNDDKQPSASETKKSSKPPIIPPSNDTSISDDDSDSIDDYEMTSSEEINQFMSGKTLEDVFGDNPEGSQNYYVQKLSDMLQDGKNMINKAQTLWGNEITEYGKNLFEYIQNMSNDKQLTNKKAVLLATFLGEIKEFQLRNPDRASEVRQLHNTVEQYYQNYMNVRGKEVVAGRLLRLYRDKYIGDLFVDKILEETEIKQKKAIEQAEMNQKVTDEAVYDTQAPVSEAEKKAADNAEKKAAENDKKKQDKKKSMSVSEAQRMAAEKLKEIQAKVGDVNTSQSLAEKIKNLINNINCK